MALLGTRTTPCDAILEDFVAFKHATNLQAEKQWQTMNMLKFCTLE